MTVSRHILMGDPSSFSIRKGANPHTRNWLGLKKRVDLKKAMLQWHRMVETLQTFDVTVHVVPPHPELPGLVFPANAGVALDVEKPMPLDRREFVLSHLGPARRDEEEIYSEVLSSLGVQLHRVTRQFEGEADFFPWDEQYLFTFGKIERQRFVPRLGLPPWKRIYGFRSDPEALADLVRWVDRDRILMEPLADEAFYHGDTVFASFGPHREFLLAYSQGIRPEGRKLLGGNPRVIWISESDALRFAANSFQIIRKGECVLFMPEGISVELYREIEKREVRVVRIDVSEFYEKGGGSVKCMIGDLGA